MAADSLAQVSQDFFAQQMKVKHKMVAYTIRDHASGAELSNHVLITYVDCFIGVPR